MTTQELINANQEAQKAYEDAENALRVAYRVHTLAEEKFRDTQEAIRKARLA